MFPLFHIFQIHYFCKYRILRAASPNKLSVTYFIWCFFLIFVHSEIYGAPIIPYEKKIFCINKILKQREAQIYLWRSVLLCRSPVRTVILLIKIIAQNDSWQSYESDDVRAERQVHVGTNRVPLNMLRSVISNRKSLSITITIIHTSISFQSQSTFQLLQNWIRAKPKFWSLAQLKISTCLLFFFVL